MIVECVKVVYLIYQLTTNTNTMTNSNFKLGQKINYSNGNPSIYQGIIVKIKKNTLIVIDDEAGLQLYKAGHNVGNEITLSQIK